MINSGEPKLSKPLGKREKGPMWTYVVTGAGTKKFPVTSINSTQKLNLLMGLSRKYLEKITTCERNPSPQLPSGRRA
jgi:hypothetical protein